MIRDWDIENKRTFLVAPHAMTRITARPNCRRKVQSEPKFRASKRGNTRQTVKERDSHVHVDLSGERENRPKKNA